jgi:hypothetical protein
MRRPCLLLACIFLLRYTYPIVAANYLLPEKWQEDRALYKNGGQLNGFFDMPDSVRSFGSFSVISLPVIIVSVLII